MSEKLIIKPRKRILFVCTSNQLRSVTAENLYKDDTRFEVLSCGTDKYARVVLDYHLVLWAEVIVCMEKEHEDTLYKRYGREAENSFVYTLNIKDNYDRDQPELRDLIEHKVEALIKIVDEEGDGAVANANIRRD
jgi:predicted protein tyrosine phosphatase